MNSDDTPETGQNPQPDSDGEIDQGQQDQADNQETISQAETSDGANNEAEQANQDITGDQGAIPEAKSDDKSADKPDDPQQPVVKPAEQTKSLDPQVDPAILADIEKNIRKFQEDTGTAYREASSQAASAIAYARWASKLYAAIGKDAILQAEQQEIAVQAAEAARKAATSAGESYAEVGKALQAVLDAKEQCKAEPAQQAQVTAQKAYEIARAAAVQVKQYAASVKTAAEAAQGFEPPSIFGNSNDHKWLKNRYIWRQILGTGLALIIIAIIFFTESIRLSSNVWLGIVISIGVLIFAFYRPRGNAILRAIPLNITSRSLSTTSTDDSILKDPPLPFTHPAVFILGIYLVVLTLLCLDLVLEIGTQLAPEPTATPITVAEATPEATAAPVSNDVQAFSLKVAIQAEATAEATPEATAEATPEPPPSDPLDKTIIPPPPKFPAHILGRVVDIAPETRLLLLIVLSGALGALLKSIQSYRTYLGENNFRGSWIPYYITEPFVGSVLALLFYVLIRGGLFSSGTVQSTDTNTFGLVATSGLIGLFNGQAMKKLKQLAEVTFAQNVGEDATIEDEEKKQQQKDNQQTTGAKSGTTDSTSTTS